MKRWAFYIGGGFIAWRIYEAWRGQISLVKAFARPFEQGQNIYHLELIRHADLCEMQNPEWDRAQCMEKASMSFPLVNLLGKPKQRGGSALVIGDDK
jgi:hypothetical protein